MSANHPNTSQVLGNVNIHLGTTYYTGYDRMATCCLFQYAPFLIIVVSPDLGNHASCVISLEQRANGNISATIIDANYNGFQIHTNSAGDYVRAE